MIRSTFNIAIDIIIVADDYSLLQYVLCMPSFLIIFDSYLDRKKKKRIFLRLRMKHPNARRICLSLPSFIKLDGHSLPWGTFRLDNQATAAGPSHIQVLDSSWSSYSRRAVFFDSLFEVFSPDTRVTLSACQQRSWSWRSETSVSFASLALVRSF